MKNTFEKMVAFVVMSLSDVLQKFEVKQVYSFEDALALHSSLEHILEGIFAFVIVCHFY